jgi:hypothetical protein
MTPALLYMKDDVMPYCASVARFSLVAATPWLHGRTLELDVVLCRRSWPHACSVPRSPCCSLHPCGRRFSLDPLAVHACLPVSRNFKCRMLIACDNVSEAYKGWYTVHKPGDCFNSITCSLFKAAVSGVIPFELSAPRSKLWYSTVHSNPISVF